MTPIRIYRAGQDEPLRVVGQGGPQPLTHHADPQPRGDTRFARAGVVVALLVAAAVLGVLYGRGVYGDVTGLVGFAGNLHRLPDWVRLVATAAAAVAFVSLTCYLAFGRRVAVKAVGLAVLVAALATPGFALGYVDRNLSSMGSGGSAEQRAAVKSTQGVLQHPLPDQPMNILLLGIDHSGPGDPGRSDSQILLRLDPQAKTISMLSLPRDLRWDVPGVGYTKMNAAYTYGGPRLAIKTFEAITGLPINHFIRVDFAGFWHIVDIVGGVYLPVDHRYYNTEGNGYQPINLQPGYQLLRAKQSLTFVRYRHDQKGDFTRMVRQQMFLREVQRQARRWSGDWTRVLAMTRAMLKQTTTDLDSLDKLLPVVNLALTLNTSHIYQTHLEGSTPTINGVSYVVDTPSQIAAAVQQFEHPTQPKTAGAAAPPKSSYQLSVTNANGAAGLAAQTAAALKARGYRVTTVQTAAQTQATTVVAAPQDLAGAAQALAGLLAPAQVRLSASSPANAGRIAIVLGTGYAGAPQAVATTPASPSPAPAIAANQRYDWSAWRALAKMTPLVLEAPTAWAPGLGYDTAGVPFRAYSIQTTAGRHAAAAIAVGTYGSGYWGVQAMRWTNPPAIVNPSAVQTIGGRTYLLFYQDANLHMVAWRENGALYWVINTLENELPNGLLLKLAESCRPVA